MENEDRFCKVPCTEEMIPVVNAGNEPESIQVLVDDCPARCFITNPIVGPESNGSVKIVILFDEQHQRWGDYFVTKYFEFEEPGVMNWGTTSGGQMRILC